MVFRVRAIIGECEVELQTLELTAKGSDSRQAMVDMAKVEFLS